MIKTFPKQINFHWIEWEGHFFDCVNQKIINASFLLMNGTIAILNGKLFYITTVNKIKRNQKYKKLVRKITHIKILFSSRILFLTDICSTVSRSTIIYRLLIDSSFGNENDMSPNIFQRCYIKYMKKILGIKSEQLNNIVYK